MKKLDLAFVAGLVPLDFSAIIISAISAYTLRYWPFFTAFKPIAFDLSFETYLTTALLVSPIYLITFALAGLYSFRPRPLSTVLGRIMLACTAALAAILVIAFFLRELFDSRFIIIAVWVLTIAMVFLGRVLIRGIQKKLRGYGYGLTRVAIIGKTKSAEALKDWFLSLPSYGFSPVLQLVGFDSQSQQELLVLKSQGKLDAILLANPEANKDEVKALKWFTEVENLGFYYLAELLPGGHLRPNVHTFAGRPVIELPVTPLDGWGAIYKRIFDIVGALGLIAVTLPIQLIVAILLFVEQPGMVLFNALPNGEKVKRVGQGGNLFFYFKFRSMIKNAHSLRFNRDFLQSYGNDRSNSPLFKLSDDPRVTPVGKILRRLSLDELPEFYLVLAGKMSLVGPRPHLPEEVAKYSQAQRRVLRIKPGITGLPQISGRAKLDFEDEIRLDMYYLENWSPWLDIVILLRTPFVVISQNGAG